jgi:hypothetical protein
MPQLLKDCLTLKNGEDYDVGRVLLMLGAVAFVILSFYGVYQAGEFDPERFGAGYGMILGGGGIGIAVKSHTEPN